MYTNDPIKAYFRIIDILLQLKHAQRSKLKIVYFHSRSVLIEFLKFVFIQYKLSITFGIAIVCNKIKFSPNTIQTRSFNHNIVLHIKTVPEVKRK